MSDLESLVRDALSDDRRRLAPPHDTATWVAKAVRRQRRRHAVVGVVATAAVALAAVAVVVPLANDQSATYVAGRPDAASGLLPWAPVGTLTEESDVVAAAVGAWESLADDQPAGDVYLVAGDRWDETDVVLLQARTDSGTASVALLTTADGAAGPWELKGTTELAPDSDVQALVLPADTIPSQAMPRGTEPGSPPSLVLGPHWRVSSLRDFPPSVGSQLVPAGPGFGDEPSWQPLDRVGGYGWWAPLSMAAQSALSPTTVVFDHTGHGYANVAPVLALDGSAGLSPLTPSDVSLRLLPNESAQPEALGDIGAVMERLGLTGPAEVTVLNTGSGAIWFGKREPPNTDSLFAQVDTPDARHPLLVAYATTAGEVTCFSKRRVPATDVTSLPFVGMACPEPVVGGLRRGIQSNLLWARSFFDEPGMKSSVLDITVTIVRPNGQSSQRNVPTYFGGSGSVSEGTTEPVLRYVFRATETFDGVALTPWIWPASSQ